MGAISYKYFAGALALAGIIAALPQGQARAQTADTLPTLTVTARRSLSNCRGVVARSCRNASARAIALHHLQEGEPVREDPPLARLVDALDEAC